MIPKDHRVRAVWAYVEALDLSALYEKIQAVEGRVGRDAGDPKILMALWMFATIEAVSSARQLHRLTERDLAYVWICGGVGVNYHLLSDFRTGHGAFLDQLLTDTIATLLHQNIVTLETVAQDGMRVRAHAGSGSFRRKKTLERCREEAAEQVQKLRDESDDDTTHDASDRRRKATAQRVVTERQQRVDEALKNLDERQQQKEKRKKGTGESTRCSTTDPDARTMKRGDGGFRPAFNVQFATDGDSRIIVGVDVTNNGSDGGQMAPMHARVVEAYGKTPTHDTVDGGFSSNDDITQVEQSGSQVAAPMTHADSITKGGGDPHARRAGDSNEMANFRERRRSPESQAILKRRPSIAELPQCRMPQLRSPPDQSSQPGESPNLHAVVCDDLQLHAHAAPEDRLSIVGVVPVEIQIRRASTAPSESSEATPRPSPQKPHPALPPNTPSSHRWPKKPPAPATPKKTHDLSGYCALGERH